jgi:hypothetical protein
LYDKTAADYVEHADPLQSHRHPATVDMDHIASEQDLLRLKKIAKAHRSAPGDAQDIAFLEARRNSSGDVTN